MTEPKRCCKNPIKLVILYNNDKIISVCNSHSKHFEYQRDIKAIFDYITKKELTHDEAFL